MRLQTAAVALAVSLLAPTLVLAQADYPLTPASEPQPGVPKGTLTKHSFRSQTFAGTVRDFWVYVPARYTPGTPAAVMVFQDGGRHVDEKGSARGPPPCSKTPPE